MHHSESVASAIKEIRKTLKKNGLFIFWIINQQKPIRKITDSFFRDHFKEINPKNITNEVPVPSHIPCPIPVNFHVPVCPIPYSNLVFNFNSNLNLLLKLLVYMY